MPLTPQQALAARMIGRGHPRETTAKAVGCSIRTLFNWQRLPGFMDAARAAQGEVGEPGALDVLRDLMSSAQESIRLGAAKALLTAPPPPPGDPGPPQITVYARNDEQQPAAEEPGF